MQLPEDFVQETRQLMGEERFSRFMAAFDEDAPVSIRLNPLKVSHAVGEGVPWCPAGIYLSGRPQFTFDPLLSSAHLSPITSHF